MIQLQTAQTVPLRMEEGGTIRVIGSRVTLDTIVGNFQQGYTAEEIQESFPTLKLEQIYSILAYYLTHEADVNAYLRKRRSEAEKLRKFWENQPRVKAFTAKLRAARARRLAGKAETACQYTSEFCS